MGRTSVLLLPSPSPTWFLKHLETSCCISPPDEISPHWTLLPLAYYRHPLFGGLFFSVREPSPRCMGGALLDRESGSLRSTLIVAERRARRLPRAVSRWYYVAGGFHLQRAE